MNPDERAALQYLGRYILNNACDVIVMVLLSGIIIGPFCVVTHVTIKQGLVLPSRRILLGISVFAVLLACTCGVGSAAAIYLEISVFINNPGVPMSERRYLSGTTKEILLSVRDWSFAILPFSADTITLWRGGVLFPEYRWKYAMILCLYISGLAILLTQTALHFSKFEVSRKLDHIMYRAGVVLSFVGNLLGTGLTAYGVWSYRSSSIVRLNLKIRRQIRAYRLLRLVLESGLAYCVLQMMMVIACHFPRLRPFKFSVSARRLVQEMLVNAYIMISAIYPTLITILVKHKNKSFMQTYSCAHAFQDV